MIGRTLGHYRIEARLGEGGMGVVYKALDTKLNRAVAIKVLPPEMTADRERRLRFRREAQAAAALNHPNICTVYAVEEHDGVDFLVMEYLEGQTLRERIGHKPMPVKSLLPIAIQVGAALEAAHERGVLHRDLKPDNVFVTKQGPAKALDFGLAKVLHPDAGGSGEGGGRLGATPEDVHSQLETISRELTREGKVFGTVAYMSPEQARGERVDHQSDLFSFGVVLYEMATGKVPFKGRTDAETLASIIKDEPPPVSAVLPEVHPDFERIVGKALEKDPQDRYHHADEMVADLRKLKRVTESGVQTVRTPGAPVAAARASLLGRWLGARRGRQALALAAAALLLAAGAAAWRIFRAGERFHPGDRILVADFENATGRPEIEGAVRDAFEDLLGSSRFVKVIRGDDRRKLFEGGLQGAPLRIGMQEAEALCARGECAGYLVGRIGREEAAYRLEAGLHRAGRKDPAIARSAVIQKEEDILRTIFDMVLDLRRALGESPQSVSAATPPTTRSLIAYQAYSLGSLMNAMVRPAEEISLRERALEIDPDFVDAYSSLAVAYSIAGKWKEYRKFAEQAYRRSEGLPDQTRLSNEILYLDSLYDFDAEIGRLQRYLGLYPNRAEEANWLAWVYLIPEQDPVAGEDAARRAYRLSGSFVDLFQLTESLGLQGNVEEIEKTAADFRKRGGSASQADSALLSLHLVRREWKLIDEIAGRLEREPGAVGIRASGARLWALLASGRLSAAREAAAAAWRSAESAHDYGAMDGAGQAQAWLDARLRGRAPALTEEQIRPARDSLLFLPGLAASSVDLRLAGPLEPLIRQYEISEKGSQSRFVLEELQFARGCAALARGEASRARELLEPLARNSILNRRHHVLARTYEALRMWRDAAAEYEEMLKEPHRIWIFHNPAEWVLDELRLAGVYERLGDPERARQWYERFLADWKDADPDIPELIEARKRMKVLGETEVEAK